MTIYGVVAHKRRIRCKKTMSFQASFLYYHKDEHCLIYNMGCCPVFIIPKFDLFGTHLTCLTIKEKEWKLLAILDENTKKKRGKFAAYPCIKVSDTFIQFALWQTKTACRYFWMQKQMWTVVLMIWTGGDGMDETVSCSKETCQNPWWFERNNKAFQVLTTYHSIAHLLCFNLEIKSN